jgi:hypothetical protein
MKRLILFILFFSFFVLTNAQILITASDVNTINTTQSAAEGDIYKDTENNVFYIGTSSGILKIIGDVTKVNATLSGDGSVANPLGIAPMGAASGQVLSWNGTTWIPVNAAPATTTVSNTILSGLLTTTVNGVSATSVTLPTPDGSETKLSNGTNTTVSGAGTTVSPYTVSVADATISAKGVIQLAGDLTGSATSPQIAANAVTTAEIANATILNEDITDNTVASGKILDGTIATADIGNAQVTYAKIQNVAAQRIVGNPTASAATPSEISLGTGLSFSGTVLNATNNGTVTTVTGTSPIVITGTPTSTPNVTITRNNIVAGTSSSSATSPLVLDAGATNAVVGGANATLTVNNTAAFWNANQLQGNAVSSTVPTTGQVLRYDGTNWVPYTLTSTSNKKIVLSAEYAGAVIVPGSGTDIHRGDMTGGNTGTTSPYYMNYYEWKGRYSGSQTYQVVVRITLPNDFTSWQSSNPFQFYNMSNTGCNVTVIAFLSTSTTAFYSGSAISNSGWTLSSLTTANLSSWATAGLTASFVFTFSSTNGNVSRIGDIILNYQ